MSRVSASVVCNEDQLNALNSIVQNSQYDKEYVQRAQIILQLNEGLQVKQVAENLSANPITVRKWRDRFLKDGVDGLSNAPRSGRRGNDAEPPEKRIREAQAADNHINGEEPTSNSAEELSRRTGISTDVIYKLARKGEISITPVRQTIWSVGADSDTVAKNTILEGIYISSDTAMLILSASVLSTAPAQAVGVVTTRSKDHAAALMKDEPEQGIQPLLDLLFDAQKLNESRRGNGKSADPMDYLQQIARSHSMNAFTEYHAIVFSEQKPADGKLTVPGIFVEYVDSMQDFLLLIKHFFNLLRKENRTNTPGWKVQERVQKLCDSMSSGSEPFIWTRTVPKQQTQLVMQMIYTDEDGESFIINVKPESPIKKISDFNVSDLDGFRADVGDLEKSLMDASNRLVGDGIKAIINGASKKNEKPVTGEIMLEAECGKIPVSVPEELLRKLPRHGTPVVYTPGLDRFIFNAVKDCSYAHATELANLGYHRRCGEQLAVTSVQDYVSATGDAVRSRVQDELEAVLNDYGVAFDDNGCIKDGNRIPESAIHPSIPQNSPTRITKKAIKRVMKLFNSSRPRDQWIHYKKARACLEEDPMYTCYCFIDDICTKHQKEKRSATVCSQAKSDDESRRLLYTTDIYVLYRDQRYCFTAPNTTEGCRMLLGYLLKNHLLENNDLVFFSDGADEIRKALEKAFSFRPYKHLLDWFHVRKICYEYFTGLLKGGKGRLEENNQTRKKFFDLLWSGNFDGARAFVESLTDDQIKREASRQTLLGYLDRKQSRLYEYAVRKGLRLINTSNRVEQINNLLIAERQKKNGMSWCNIGSPALANITMLFLNNEFDGWERNHQLSYRLTKTNGETCRVEWTPELDAAWRAA